jgi:hypothetical protein
VAMALSEIFVAPIEQDNAMPFYLNTLAGDALPITAPSCRMRRFRQPWATT